MKPLSQAHDPFHKHKRTMLYSALLIGAVLAIGTTGYTVIEGWNWFDSLYMTVITMTTIGYQEVHSLSTAGRVFTVLFIFLSVGAVLYTFNNAARLIVEGELNDIFGRRKLQSRIQKLSGHYIICGYGRMGKIICQELLTEGSKFVVVEKVASPELAAITEFPVMVGDATIDDTLKSAGIDRAAGLISVLPTDAENLFVVLSARGLNPGLFIVARAVLEDSEKKLMRAGASRVVSPYHIGGLRIAHTIIKPAVVDFIEFTTNSGNIDLQMEEIKVSAGSQLISRTISESGIGRDLGVIVVSIKNGDGRMQLSPNNSTVIAEGDTLIVLGEKSKVTTLEKMAKGAAGPFL